jgi:hypothetical protein
MSSFLSSCLFKESLTVVGIGMTVYALGVYLFAVLRKKTKPHAFTWFVWALLTGIAFAVQFSKDAGPGLWVTGFTALGCFIIFLFSLRVTDKDIAKSDWVAFVIALVALGIWALTKQPLWSIILISGIDAIAFYPTFRKSWAKPEQENLTAFIVGGLKFLVSIVALESFSLTTYLYPATIAFMNLAFAVMLIMRRKALSTKVPSYA